MSLSRIVIKNFKSIKECDIAVTELNVFIGENGAGKSNLLDAIRYFYANLTDSAENESYFDENNRYSNEIRITLFFDLSELIKIANKNLGREFVLRISKQAAKTKYSGYYRKILTLAAKAKIRHLLRVEMQQIKGRGIHWNFGYDERAVIKSLFPLYAVDTRNLDLDSWNYVWNILAEISKVSNDERKVLAQDIRNILLADKKEVTEKAKVIEALLEEADISIKKDGSQEFAKRFMQLYLTGSKIRQGGKQLSYYSTGTSSVKYIELLTKAVSMLSKAKLKEPVLVIDEPEIGLHTSYIDELSESLALENKKLCRIIATHSSRLIKDIVIRHEKSFLFKIMLKRYTTVQKLRKFMDNDNRLQYRVTDDHINTYFSRAILFVEGETELELFANPYLKLLFPALRYIDVFKGMSDNAVYNIMNPKTSKLPTPYLRLIDMDKAFSYKPDTGVVIKKNDYLGDKVKTDEKRQYMNKKQTDPWLYSQHCYIENKMAALYIPKPTRYESCGGRDFDMLLDSIHNYLKAYRIFALRTTIEGVLINGETVDLAINFYNEVKKRQTRIITDFNIYHTALKPDERLNFLRVIYNGKNNLLLKSSDFLTGTDKDFVEHHNIGNKTNGWLSAFLAFYFKSFLPIDTKLTPSVFQNFLKNEQQRKSVIHDFYQRFSELATLMDCLSDMIELENKSAV